MKIHCSISTVLNGWTDLGLQAQFQFCNFMQASFYKRKMKAKLYILKKGMKPQLSLPYQAQT